MKQLNLLFLIMICLLIISHANLLAQKTQLSSVVNSEKENNYQGDTIHIVGHAHMDMNWLWTYFETMKMCNDNLRQTVAFMDEFPDFTMMQSQAAVYKFVEMVDPPLFKRIQEYVKEGRLELGGGMWTESDTNLPSGEALARSFLLGQRYFLKHFDKMAKVSWLPDNFGHNSQLPQLFKLAGMEYFYFTRCKPYMGSFWWEGPDGTKVLCYANSMPNETIKEDLKNELKKIAPDKNRILHVTGVGDHGGGPTRANIEMIHKLDKTPNYPAVKFTTASDFFNALSGEMDGRPTHTGEMQFIFEGCYTTVSEIKDGNRNCENSMYSSEFFNTFRWINGDKYPQNELNDLWETVVFNQFHDILPGSAINEANKQAIARYNEAERKSTELKDKAILRLTDEIKFQDGLGQPVVAFNLIPCQRKAIVEATVYSHEEPLSVKVASWGSNYYGKNFIPVNKENRNLVKKENPNFLQSDGNNQLIPIDSSLATVLVRDGSGKSYPAQITYSKRTPPGYTSKVQFIDDYFPAGGYKTYYIDVLKEGEINNTIKIDENTFETDFFIITFDMNKGSIISLFDKRSKMEYVKKGGELNKLKIYLEDKKGKMKAWTINKIIREEDVSNVESVKVIERGPVRACVETIKTWGKSRFIERIYIYKSYPRIEYNMEVHWLETGTDSTDSPMLRAIFPIAIENPVFNCHVPFNVVERPTDLRKIPTSYKRFVSDWTQNEGHDGQEVPAQKWVDLSNGEIGIALLNRSRYGHSYHQGELRLTLMRAAGAPDIYPNLGKFEINYALFPHPGDWKNGVWNEGNDFNVPVHAYEPPSLALVKEHATRIEENSLISLDGKGVYLTGIKKAEETDELILRLVEVEGNEQIVNIKLPSKINSVRKLNLIEFPLNDNIDTAIKDNSVQFKIRAHEIVTLGIMLEK